MTLFRLPTGIDNFDKLIEGGIPIGSTVLLAGNPGIGTTLFTSHLIHSNSYTGKSIYCGFFEKKESYIKNSTEFGFDFKSLVENERLSVLEFYPMLENGITTIVSKIESEIKKLKPTLLVIDSFSSLSGDLTSMQEIRILLKMINSITRAYNTTVIFILEIPYGSQKLGIGVEEFITDSIILLKYSEQDGETKRFLNVLKMRNTNHDIKIHEFSITSSGIHVLSENQESFSKRSFVENLLTPNEKLSQK